MASPFAARDGVLNVLFTPPIKPSLQLTVPAYETGWSELSYKIQRIKQYAGTVEKRACTLHGVHAC